jgi:hypothetical protein
MRRIPATMATQHPDSATTYVPVQKEAEEAVKVLMPARQGGFGIEEHMIDFEGKMTPYVQTSEVVVELILRDWFRAKMFYYAANSKRVTRTVFAAYGSYVDYGSLLSDSRRNYRAQYS